MANHGVINTTHSTCWDTDAKNFVGICADADIDNGSFVTLGNIKRDNATQLIEGYEFNVTSATTTSADYVVATPVVGSTLLMQISNDPRNFYNQKGNPMSVKRLETADCIEVSADCFSTAPTVGTSTHAKVVAGKLVAQADDTGAHFQILGATKIDIGQELIDGYLLMKL